MLNCISCMPESLSPCNDPRPGPPPDSSLRDSYTKYDYRIPMRDGIHIFTSVYIPKDVLNDA